MTHFIRELEKIALKVSQVGAQGARRDFFQKGCQNFNKSTFNQSMDVVSFSDFSFEAHFRDFIQR